MKHAFYYEYKSRARVLITPVKVSLPLDKNEEVTSDSPLKEYNVIWDTGATNSAITKKSCG